MRRPKDDLRHGFTTDSTSRELLRELFDRVEQLTARLDRLSRPSDSSSDDFEHAPRQPATQPLNRLAPSRRQEDEHVNTTDARNVPALDIPDRMQSSESGHKRPSPYLDAKGASDYLGITLNSLYGIVERGNLVPLRGPKRRYRFTEAMLDEYLRRKGGQG